MQRVRRWARGFTLIEVLVALSIVAIALLAGLKATGALSFNAKRQDQAVLGQICAENELIRLRLLRQLPAVGNSSQACEQAGQTMDVALTVLPTPNPNFRRVDVRVSSDEVPILQLSAIMGSQ